MDSITNRILLFLTSGLLSISSFVLQAQNASSEVPWTLVREGTITFYAQGSPAQAISFVHSFRVLQNVLVQASPFHVDQTAIVKVIAFNSEKEFTQYRLNSGSCAFYQQSQGADRIVLQDLDAEHREVSLHEFTHFVLAHSGLALPLWLNEGLADFYSTFEVSGDGVRFGRSVSGRLPILRSSAWLPLNELFDISTRSSYYSEPERMWLFYSESWALTHMLAASPAYTDGFPNFIRALGESHNAAKSLQLAYNKTVSQIQNDLHDYVYRGQLPVVEARLTSVNSAPSQTIVLKPSNAEIDIALADLAVTNPNMRPNLETRLASAANQLPDDPEAEEALGYLALRQGRSSEARVHFQLAVDRHSSDPNVSFYLAHLEHETGAPSSQVIPLLERALTLKPDLSEARLELGLIAASDGSFTKALEALRNLTGLRPANAYAAAYTAAYCYAHIAKFSEARIAARQAQTLAQNDHDRAANSELINYINQEAQELMASSTNLP